MTTGARPVLHFTAHSGWVNDPLALTFHEGQYHLFFQHVPGATRWQPSCHWGHATSRDLLHWSEGPVALEPGDGDDGCWSGGIVALHGRDAALFYTSVRHPDLARGRVRAARPTDSSWQRWVKGDIVVEAPEDVETTLFRDPVVFRDGECWRMIVGAGLAGGTAAALAYTSLDLQEWSYTGPLTTRSGAERASVWTGTGWECPNLVRLGDSDVLVVSVWAADALHYVAGALGALRQGRFSPRQWVRLSYGPLPYAASAFIDERGRPGLIWWLRVADPGNRWAGALSLPAVMALDDDDRLTLDPHPNVARARGPQLPTHSTGAASASHWPAGSCVDVEWAAHPAVSSALALHDGRGEVVAELHAANQSLTLTSVGTPGESWAMPWAGGGVRLVLDGPTLEVFSSGATMAAAIEPGHEGVHVRPASGPGTYRCWQLDERDPSDRRRARTARL